MNDFTLEELRFLEKSVYLIKLHNSGYYGDKKDYLDAQKLQEKVQSHIDSYCDKNTHDGIECEGLPCSGNVWSAS